MTKPAVIWPGAPGLGQIRMTEFYPGDIAEFNTPRPPSAQYSTNSALHQSISGHCAKAGCSNRTELSRSRRHERDSEHRAPRADQ
jgi:hypothetical protein